MFKALNVFRITGDLTLIIENNFGLRKKKCYYIIFNYELINYNNLLL